MKRSWAYTFIALSATFFAILPVSHIYFDVYDFVPQEWPWLVIQDSARTVVACLLSGGLTALIFHFKKA